LQKRQDQLVLHQEKIDLFSSNETVMKQRMEEMQIQQQQNSSDKLNTEKEGITAIQSTAKDVASGIEEFRDQLTNILRDTYSYEQLLLSHEGLQHSIQVLRGDLRENEDRLEKLQAEKAELEQQFNHKSEEWRSGEESRLDQAMLLESNILHLREQLSDCENQLEELRLEKDNMEASFTDLQRKYEEKDRMASEMMTVARDMERKFAHFYRTSNGETLHPEREEIQLR